MRLPPKALKCQLEEEEEEEKLCRGAKKDESFVYSSES
jgi:hypothetical protein